MLIPVVASGAAQTARCRLLRLNSVWTHLAGFSEGLRLEDLARCVQLLQGQQLVCWRLGHILLHVPYTGVRQGSSSAEQAKLATPMVVFDHSHQRYMHGLAALMQAFVGLRGVTWSQMQLSDQQAGILRQRLLRPGRHKPNQDIKFESGY